MKYDYSELEKSKWCLLENGDIVPTHYDYSEELKAEGIPESLWEKNYGNGSLRDFDEDPIHGDLILNYDEEGDGYIASVSRKVLALGQSREELEKYAEGKI